MVKGNLAGSTLGGTGGVVGTGCTIEIVRPERVAAHVGGVVEVALGFVAAAAPRVLVAAAHVVDDADCWGCWKSCPCRWTCWWRFCSPVCCSRRCTCWPDLTALA